MDIRLPTINDYSAHDTEQDHRRQRRLGRGKGHLPLSKSDSSALNLAELAPSLIILSKTSTHIQNATDTGGLGFSDRASQSVALNYACLEPRTGSSLIRN
jgi:hypothetical protein